ncbi:macro domain-like protein [Punctularia strigosozonata HHB-11173 SS5]|uniref:macro domain-like protein n=1 Tax=Punctularia strigosozonata (strain HHB-11173) TaxID=741275 RepID=UPI0004417582|nr:macro domain-like protein [Punctularia strigosozonata HHB-11173 SS5]EIN14694.1 macro domain-like protein [Punctularia strigosozonata HHB-11173 SS5]
MSFPPIDFLLIDTKGVLCAEWKEAFSVLPDDVNAHFTFLQSSLDDLPSRHSGFDCAVSPANSYGIMDGGFDYYLSRAFKPVNGEFEALTRHVQKAIYERYTGYLPPASCIVVDLRKSELKDNKFGANSIAVLPTMRYPEDVTWDKDLVYNCMWNLLVQLSKNCPGEPGFKQGAPPIKKVLMTGLATGVGGISAKKCAAQMALAVKHFAEARQLPAKHIKSDWSDVSKRHLELEKTRSM